MDTLKIAFIVPPSMGDAIIVKKVFDTITKVEKNCKIDILSHNITYANKFYSYSQNVHEIFNLSQINFQEKVKEYDLVLQPYNSISIIFANIPRLQTLSPSLLECLGRIDLYNRKYMYEKDFAGQILFNMARARILKSNCYTTLASEGALPITDNRVEINLLPEWKNEFEKLELKRYITIGSNGGSFGRHTIKEWPTRYYVEFIALLKAKMPQIQIVQSGGGGVEKVENADVHLCGKDLELVKYVLKNSLLHIDCEGGPVHLASQLGTKCVVFFGVTDVNYYGYSQNINLVSEVCSPCYFVWENNKDCMLKSKEPPCMLSITPQKVFEVTYNYLKSLE